jgi:hypothetical protein
MYQADVRNGKIQDIKDIIDRVQNIIAEKKANPVAQAKEGIPAGHNELPVQEEVSEAISETAALRRKNLNKRHNALRMNKIPVECEFCGGDIDKGPKGEYICVSCGKENYDDFNKIRNYIQKYGPAPAIVVSRNTGVPMATIEYFKANGDVKDIRRNGPTNLW